MANEFKQGRYLPQPTNEKGQFQSYSSNPTTSDKTTAREKEQILAQIRNLLDKYGLSYNQQSEIIKIIKKDYSNMSDRERVFGKV